MAKHGDDVRVAAAALLAAGETWQGTADATGTTKETIRRWMQDADFRAQVATAQAGFREAAGLSLRALASEAVETVGDVMRTARSDGDRLKAALAILDRVGIVADAEEQRQALDVWDVVRRAIERAPHRVRELLEEPPE